MNLSFQPFLLYTTAASAPLTDPTVRQEVTPSYRHGVNTQPSASQLAGTASSVSSQLNLLRPPGPTLTPFGQPEEGRHSVINPSPMVLSPVYWSNLTVRPAAVNSVHHPPQSVPDTERPSRPSGVFHLYKNLHALHMRMNNYCIMV